MKNVIVIGGGASGLMAAYAAAQNGNRVTLIEKNEKLGKKIYITGKGRCNLTNDCAPADFLDNVVRGRKFLTGVTYAFPSEKTMQFFEERGLPLKIERGNRVFPVSDKASDVTKTLEIACKNAGVSIKLNEEVLKIEVLQSTMRGITTNKAHYECDCAIVATGGLSYPSTGSTGDGYNFAKQAGHSITPPVPSLVGLELSEPVSSAQGITLKNVTLFAKFNGKVIFSELGELLFTHFGISGPLVLSLSAKINRMPLDKIELFLDFKPALDRGKLENRLLRDFSERKNEQIKSVMRGLLPAGLVYPVLNRANVIPTKKTCEVQRAERERLIETLKRYPLALKRLRGFSEAVVTSGGVDVTQIDPKTMQSKLVKGLYFCGEVLDVDAYTGGYNLQIAFSSGFIAGNSIK